MYTVVVPGPVVQEECTRGVVPGPGSPPGVLPCPRYTPLPSTHMTELATGTLVEQEREETPCQRLLPGSLGEPPCCHHPAQSGHCSSRKDHGLHARA